MQSYVESRSHTLMNHIKLDTNVMKHPSQDGIFIRDLYLGEDTGGGLSNREITVLPGFGIEPHTHGESEFFYVIEGSGEFLDDTVWRQVRKGDAFTAPKGMNHCIRNTGLVNLMVLSAFSPSFVVEY